MIEDWLRTGGLVDSGGAPAREDPYVFASRSREWARRAGNPRSAGVAIAGLVSSLSLPIARSMLCPGNSMIRAVKRADPDRAGLERANRALVGMAMAAILLVPGAATAWMAWLKVHLVPVPPAPLPLSLAGRRVRSQINLFCAVTAGRASAAHGGSPDARGLAVGRATTRSPISRSSPPGSLRAITLSAWPDLIVGLGDSSRSTSTRRARSYRGRPRRAPRPRLRLDRIGAEAAGLRDMTCRGRLLRSCYAVCDRMAIGRDDGRRESGYNAPPRPVSNDCRTASAYRGRPSAVAAQTRGQEKRIAAYRHQ